MASSGRGERGCKGVCVRGVRGALRASRPIVWRAVGLRGCSTLSMIMCLARVSASARKVRFA